MKLFFIPIFFLLLITALHARAQTGVFSLAVINLGKDSVGTDSPIGSSSLPVCSRVNLCSSPLLPGFLKFNGERIDALSVKLTWHTINEINKGFWVERS